MNQFLDATEDVVAFAKNQGPQSLRIDCLSKEGVRSLYTPDFIIRLQGCHYVLAETKGTGFARDPAVAVKAKAAQEWCRAASTKDCTWEYLYVPQKVFEGFNGETLSELVGACKPALVKLVKDSQSPQLVLDVEADDIAKRVEAFSNLSAYDALPAGDRLAIRQAIQLFDFMSSKVDTLLAPVFQPLLGRIDQAAEGVLIAYLDPLLPSAPEARDRFFETPSSKFLSDRIRAMRRLLLNRSPIMPTGLLLFALEYAASDGQDDGILGAVRENFRPISDGDLAKVIKEQYDFRNEYIAHEKREPLRSVEAAQEALVLWVQLLVRLRKLVHEAPLARLA